jgi:hypothetical protein
MNGRIKKGRMEKKEREIRFIYCLKLKKKKMVVAAELE